MKLDASWNKNKKIYEGYLHTINNIKFTWREIDVIACIIHNRGEKKIASLLSISPRTVGAHVRNIMLKLGYGSREHVIDFIEKSGKLLFVKKYYLHLLIQLSFKNQLIKIGKVVNRSGITLTVNVAQVRPEEKIIFDQLKEYLKLANVTLKEFDKHSGGINADLYILPIELSKNPHNLESIFLLLSNDHDKTGWDSIKYLNFGQEEEFYFLVFQLLEKTLHHDALKQITEEFYHEYQIIENSWKGGNAEAITLPALDLNKEKINNKGYLMWGACFILCLLILSILVYKNFNFYIAYSEEKISYDLPLPHEKILLSRLPILSKIEEKFNGKQENIQTIALVGPGGSGKTTTARQYARRQKIPLVWEINAETRETILFSFEQLAYSLCKTQKDKEELDGIQKINGPLEQEKRLFVFLTKKVKTYSDWLIIYNNTETFRDIRKYFPYDAKVWGNGKVIITTRDSNIGYNNYIPAENVIQVSELSTEEKLKLFNNIINDGRAYSDEESLVIANFLEKIPPFPLDISIAAYYIKVENTSYDQYLKYLKELKKDFILTQGSILNNIGGEYNKTRYDIVTLSIKSIIAAHPDFADLLLFISTIDSQDIPRSLLTAYKDEIIVAKFIHELRKFSLIDESLSMPDKTASTFSIHRANQTIALSYLMENMKLNKNSPKLQNIANILEQYMVTELEKNRIIHRKPSVISHVEIFLSHSGFLQEITKASLNYKLGSHYFFMANYKKAKKLLEESLVVYNQYYGENHIETTEILSRLGSLYRNIGMYGRAKEVLEHGSLIHKKNHGKDHAETITILIYLGSVYRHIGDYDKALELLEHSLIIYNKNHGPDNIKTARVSAYLGSVYKNTGDYKKAKELLEQALSVYKKYYGLEHVQTAWVAIRLGNIYRIMGDYKKAKELFEPALQIYKKYNGENCIETAWALSHLGGTYSDLGDSIKGKELINQSLMIYKDYFPDNHTTMAWAMFQLANTYKHLGDYEKSQKLLENILVIYEKSYGKDHVKTASVLSSLGDCYLLKGDIEIAENLLNRALVILQQKNHPEIFASLQNLADLYVKKSSQATNKNNNFRELSIGYLTQALEIVRHSYTKNSLYEKRILLKLKNLETSGGVVQGF